MTDCGCCVTAETGVPTLILPQLKLMVQNLVGKVTEFVKGQSV